MVELPDGSYIDVIGDAVVVSLKPESGKQLKSVKWVVDGAIQSQSYTVQEGSTTPLQSPVNHVSNDMTRMEDLLSFYWNEEARNHTVSASVVYTDNTIGTAATLTVGVQKPTVNSFTDTRQANQLQRYSSGGNNSIGFFNKLLANPPAQPTEVPGEVFTSRITTPASRGGQFALIQRVKFDNISTLTDDTQTGFSSDGKFVLDDFPFPSSIFVRNYTSNYYFSGTQNIGIPEVEQYGFNYLQDSPHYGSTFASYDTAIYAKEILESNDFETYLMFKPTNGIWVGISVIDWSLRGHATYTGPGFGNANTDYGDPNNWMVDLLTPMSATLANGMNEESFPSWNDYATRIIAGGN
jgi:hypothetical protein